MFRSITSKFTWIGVITVLMIGAIGSWKVHDARDRLYHSSFFHFFVHDEPKHSFVSKGGDAVADGVTETRKLGEKIEKAATREVSKQIDNHKKRMEIETTRPHPIIEGVEDLAHGKMKLGSGSILNGVLHPRILRHSPMTRPSSTPTTTEVVHEEKE